MTSLMKKLALATATLCYPGEVNTKLVGWIAAAGLVLGTGALTLTLHSAEVRASDDAAPCTAQLSDAQKQAFAKLKKAGLERFDGEEQEIVNIWRAETLRPLAEVVFLMGQTERALALYARVLDLGQVNPNSRPRADDLVDTLSSMAALGVEPTPELWERITAVHAGLGAPW